MEKLNQQLDALIERLETSSNLRDDLDSLVSVYPFSRYEYIISVLLSHRKLSFDEYLEIRDSYIDRNLYLSIFEITAPRGFGDTWAFGHLKELAPSFIRPNKKLDDNYNGEYDFICPWTKTKTKSYNIRIVVKSSRAVNRERADEPLYIKALASDNTKRWHPIVLYHS